MKSSLRWQTAVVAGGVYSVYSSVCGQTKILLQPVYPVLQPAPSRSV